MPGRLRDRGTLSDKAQGCCNKCCEACCRLSPWNQCLCYGVVVLVATTLIVLIGGAFIGANVEGLTAPNLCGRNEVSENGTERRVDDIFVPKPINQNIYAWYLANTGIIVIVMVSMNALCCGGFVGVCCGFKTPTWAKVISVIGFLLFLAGFAILCLWLALGGYLVSTIAALNFVGINTCTRIVMYVIFLAVYVLVIMGITCLSAVWASHASATAETTKVRKGYQKNT